MVKTETLHSNPCILHEDTFYEYFTPIRHPDARYDIWGGHGLETFGEDLELVRRYDPAFVWAVVEGDSGMEWITPGFYYVNRLCYLITAKRHEFIPVEFRIRRSAHSLTARGLKRQILKLKRIIAEFPLAT